MFNIDTEKLLLLLALAFLLFGARLPHVAAQAGRMLRQLRRMADTAHQDLKAQLGPDYAGFDPADLNPRHFIRKHLLDDEPGSEPGPAAMGDLTPGERPPYDPEAT